LALFRGGRGGLRAAARSVTARPAGGTPSRPHRPAEGNGGSRALPASGVRRFPPMNAIDLLLWGIGPYVTIALLVGGTIWRYRYDKFGWTTRSSQLYEHRLLRIGSPLFHFGILVVLIGHLIGLVIPARWTEAVGMSEDAYHVQALILGGIAGFATLVGIVILVYRRRTTGPVLMSTTRNDKGMYVVLAAAIVTGLATTLLGAGIVGEGHTYRETVSPWFRSIFVLQPDVEAMS